jgi:putative exosortase-associated protein (TIGR04073 family)
VTIKARKWTTAVAMVLVLVIMMQSVPVGAQSYDPSEELPQPSTFEKSLTKLGRGLSNIMFGWAEIPVTFDRKLKAGKPLGYLLGVAPVLGATRAFMRMGIGVYEVVTFPRSSDENNFEAIIEPEFIF